MTADIPLDQTAIISFGKLINSKTISPLDLESLKKEGVVCATCKKSGSLLVTDGGPIFIHDEDFSHEPEDVISRVAKKILKKRLSEMFSQETVDQDVLYEKGVLDFAVVFSNGGKIAIEYLSSDIDSLNSHYEYFEDLGVRLLVILDWRRLQMKNEDEISSVQIGPAETSLILNREPLIYLDAEKRNFIEVAPPKAALELVRLGRVKKLGKLKCIVRRYSISQLRLVEGRMVFLDTFYSAPPKDPELPKRLASRWEKIRKVRPRGSDQ